MYLTIKEDCEKEKDSFNLQKWERKRLWTTRAFILECVMLGMEYSVTFLTLWLYIKTLIDTEYPKIFYSLVASSYLLAAVVFSVIVGRWVDQTRKVRQTFLICNTLVIIGNILYSLHFSPWLLVFGRLISGADGPLRSIISGEVARCYPDSEVLSKFSTMGMAFAMGFIVGPGVNFAFTSVDFQLGDWQVTYVNVPGVYMAVLFIITQIIVYFTVSDLSREYDLKADECKEETNEADGNEKELEVFKNNINNSFILPPPPGITVSHFQCFDEDEDRFSKSVRIPYTEKNTIIDFQDDMKFAKTVQQSHRNNTTSSTDRTRDFRLEQLEFSTMIIMPVIITGQHRQQRQGEHQPLLASGSASYSSTSSVSTTTDSTTSTDSTSSVDSILCQILTNFDAVLILVLTFTLWYWMVAFDMWLPIMVVDVMGMGINELNGIVFGFGCISAIILLLMSFKTFSDKLLFKLSLFCMIALAMMEVIFIMLRNYHSNMYVNVVSWTIWGTLFAVVVIMDEVFLVGVLAKMTDSKIQTFNESLRLAMSRFGALLALLTSAVLFEFLEYACSVGIVISIIAFGLLFYRRKTLSKPTISIK